MGVEKFFEQYNNASVIFDPIPSYSGEWEFEVTNLIKNSKKVDKINLFEQFLEEEYFKKIGKIFKNDLLRGMPIKFISMPNENNVGRCLKFSKTPLYTNLEIFLNQNIDLYGKDKKEHESYLMNLLSNFEDNEKLNEDFINALKEKLKKLKDVKEKGFESVYHDSVIMDFEFEKRFYPNLEFNLYIDSMCSLTQNYIDGLINLGDFFEQKIDFNEIYKCFEMDTFYLLFAKIIHEVSIKVEKEYELLDNSYCYLGYYNQILENILKEDKNYNPKINFTLDNGKRIKDYSRRQFQMDFKELMERHPEAKMVAIPNLNGENDKYKDIGLIEKISMLFEDETVCSWEFLPKGEKIKKLSGKENSSPKTKEEKDINEIINEVNMRISILENSGYIGMPIKGLDTFTGYFAFIYPNGKVILEKFWDDENELKPSIGCATYVMHIDNFIELSKLTKTELIERIKTLGDDNVKRIYHTSINNWQRNLNDEINGKYRLEDAIDFINNLKTGELKNE